MRFFTVFMVAVILSCEVIAPLSSDAFIGSAVRSIGREVTEIFSRKGSKELIKEGCEAGSEKAAGFIAKYGSHGRQAVCLIGDDALKVAARCGREGVEMCAAHTAAEARFLAEHADDAVLIWRRFGKSGTALMIEHPGVAKPLLESCGKRGLQVAEKLSSENLARFANLSGRISRDNLDTMITWTLAKGDEVMDFLWRNKGVIVGGGSIYMLLKENENGFADIEIGQDGKPVAEHKTNSFIQHWLGNITRQTLRNYPWITLVAGIGFLALFLGMFGNVFTVLRKATNGLFTFVSARLKHVNEKVRQK